MLIIQLIITAFDYAVINQDPVIVIHRQQKIYANNGASYYQWKLAISITIESNFDNIHGLLNIVLIPGTHASTSIVRGI